jgi:hypothetical protein
VLRYLRWLQTPESQETCLSRREWDPIRYWAALTRASPGGLAFFQSPGARNLACRQDLDAEDVAFGIDIVNERAGLFRPFDLTAPDDDVISVMAFASRSDQTLRI